MSESNFINKKGNTVHTWQWKSGKPKGAAIYLLHGYAEYGGRYKQTATFFKEAGFDVYAIDHQGHGKSYGKHGLISSWQEMVDDAVEGFKHFKTEQSHINSWFLIGHSMGGGLAVLTATQIQEQLSGMLLSAPLIDQAISTPAFIISLGKIIGNLLPSLGIIPFDQSAQSREPDVIKAFLADSNNYKGKLRAGTGVQVLQMIEAIDTVPEKITLPVWIGHSSIDRLTSFDASKAFHSRLASADKTFRKYDGLFHEIMNEPERRIVLEEMHSWMKKRLHKLN